MDQHSASEVFWQQRNGIDLAGLNKSSGTRGLIGWSPINLTFFRMLPL